MNRFFFKVQRQALFLGVQAPGNGLQEGHTRRLQGVSRQFLPQHLGPHPHRQQAAPVEGERRGNRVRPSRDQFDDRYRRASRLRPRLLRRASPRRRFGQTLGYYGVGQGFYLVWPFLGPSTARDTVGFGGDYVLSPHDVVTSFLVSSGLRVHERVNSLSFHLGDYEALKKAAIDPYVSLRNAYVQNRAAFVEEAKKGKGAEEPGRDGERPKTNANGP